MEEEAKQEFTKDGSVDLRGRPAVAARTGRWKACSFLVGNKALIDLLYIWREIFG
jgi:peptide/histidine transporter 3/4